MLEFLADIIFVVFAVKSFPTDSWHSNGYELCPSSRSTSFCIYTKRNSFSVCSQRERNSTVSISAESHLQVHTCSWCIVYKQPRIWKLSWPDVSCWTWDQGYYREHHFRFLPRFTTVDWRDGQLHTSIYDKRDDFNFHITNYPFLNVVIFHLRRPMAFLSLQLIRYARACSSYECFILRTRRLSSKLSSCLTGIPRGTLEIVIQEVLWSIRGSYSAIWSLPLMNVNDILTLDQLQWLPNRSDFPSIIHDLDTDLNLHRITSGFHGAFASRVAMPAGNAFPSGHLVLSLLFGTCVMLLFRWDQFSWTCRMSFLDLSPGIPLGTFSILPFNSCLYSLLIPLDIPIKISFFARAVFLTGKCKLKQRWNDVEL